MPRNRAGSFAYQPLLRRAALLAGISLVLALALVSYLYGWQDHFFRQLFGSFFVFFWLLAVTFLAAVPFVGWAAANWFGKLWAETPPGPTRRKNQPAATSVSRASARPTPPARPKPSNHNHP